MRVGRVMVVGLVVTGSWLGGPGASASSGGPSTAAAATCAGRPVTIVGTTGHDFLRGTSGPDVIAGLAGNDTILGMGGRDRICGGRGSDRLLGGRGGDRLLGGADWLHLTDEGSTERVGDVLIGGAAGDLMLPGRDARPADDVIHDSLSWEAAPRGVRVDVASGRATGDGHDRFDARGAWVIGSDHADLMIGSRGRDRISSGAGSDVVQGGAGDDRIVSDPSRGAGGDDLALGGPGADQISAFGGEDVVRGGPGPDLIDDLGPAADRLYGGAGRDRLFTQIIDVPGFPQVVDGGRGRDVVDLHTQTINPTTQPSTATWDMGTGHLVFTLDHAVPASVVHVESADLSAWGTTWTVRGSSGADRLLASGSWGTVFIGLHGDDTFMGSSYDDTFRGGAGTDHSLGMGVGNDTCVSVEVLDVGDCETTSP